MPVGEYLIIFSAILIGLAVADLSLSLHRLMRQGRSIVWHPIVPLAAFIVLCLILNLWWGLYRSFSTTTEIAFLEFLPQVLMLLVLFLLAAAALPDEKLPEGASLKKYYLDNRVQFWGLFAAYLALVIANVAIGGIREGWNVEMQIERATGNAIGIALCGLMMWTRRMILHWLMVGLCLFVIIAAWGAARLSPIATG
jgi:hypothetical protein